MKREEKNLISLRRISDAATAEFSRSGYDEASLNAVCSENGISKGLLYHYFKDKEELYLFCVKRCFDAVTDYLRSASESLEGSAEEKLRGYFDARLRFFSENRVCLGLFVLAAFNPPSALVGETAELRRGFDRLNIAVLTDILKNEHLRKGLSVDELVKDFAMYQDYFNLRFRDGLDASRPAETLLSEHEESCHRQLDIMLYGILEGKK